MTNVQIANTILAQLTANRMQFWGIAAKKPMAIDNGLRISVSGAQFKGWLEVELDHGKDLYTARTVKMKRQIDREMTALLGKRTYKSVRVESNETSELFAEDLSEYIDAHIY